MKNLTLVTKLMGDKPEGRWDHDKWYPSGEETCSCCRKIRKPSRSWPYTLYKHCHTAKHKRNLLKEKLIYTEPFKTALNMTKEDALCYIDSKDKLINTVAQHLIFGRKL